jgi:Lipid A 3-O-deacylase (PagL)
MREFGLWAGFAPATATLVGTTEDRRLALLALRFGYFFGRSGPVAFEYTADFLPVAVMLERHGRPPVYGFAWAPIGFKFHLGNRRLSPFLAASCGMIYSQDPVPIAAPDATRLNFTFDFGGGLEWFASSRRAVYFGYKLHHISNAGRTSFNPGLDSQVLFAGFSFLR